MCGVNVVSLWGMCGVSDSVVHVWGMCGVCVVNTSASFEMSE